MLLKGDVALAPSKYLMFVQAVLRYLRWVVASTCNRRQLNNSSPKVRETGGHKVSDKKVWAVVGASG